MAYRLGQTVVVAARCPLAEPYSDKGLVRTVAGSSVGDKVKVAWSYDERKRAMQIQVLSRPKPRQAAKEEKSDQTP
jgi:hypothetical protein